MKNLLRKSDDPYLAQHLCWQDIAPWNCSWVEYSEAQYQLLELRELHKFLTRTWFKTKDHVDKARQKRNFDSHHGARTLPSLMLGDIVWLPDRQTEGVVQDKVASQSFQVESPDAVWTKRHLFLCQISNKHPGPSTSQIMSHSVATTDLVHTTNWYNLLHQPIVSNHSTLVDYPAYGTLYHPLIYLQVMKLLSIESRTSSGNTSSQTLTHSTLVPITSVVHAPNVRFSPNRSSSPFPMLQWPWPLLLSLRSLYSFCHLAVDTLFPTTFI